MSAPVARADPWTVTSSPDHLAQIVNEKFAAWLATSPPADDTFKCRVGIRLAVLPRVHEWVDMIERRGFTMQGTAFDCAQQVSIFDVKRLRPAKGQYNHVVLDLMAHLNKQFTDWLARNDCDMGTDCAMVARADVSELSEADRRDLARLALCSGFTSDASSTAADFAFARAPAPLIKAQMRVE